MWLSRTHSLKIECGNSAMWEYLKLANDEVARPGNRCRQCLLIYFSLVAVSWGLCGWFAREEASWWLCHSSWKLNSNVWMWEWTIKKAECRRIDAFELWCWRRLLRVPCTARRSNQSILKEFSPECSLAGLMLKLKLWPPDAKNWLIGKDPDAGKDWGQKEKGTTEDEMVGWHHRLNGHKFE